MGRRSIPACAGEPVAPERYYYPRTVYPRVCGGTENILGLALTSVGLSPRVRGNRLLADLLEDAIGSIPACAGEPRCGHSRAGLIKVYPRVCGGTIDAVPGGQ